MTTGIIKNLPGFACLVFIGTACSTDQEQFTNHEEVIPQLEEIEYFPENLGTNLYHVSKIAHEKKFSSIMSSLQFSLDVRRNMMNFKSSSTGQLEIKNGLVNKKIYFDKTTYTFEINDQNLLANEIKTMLIEEKTESGEISAYLIVLSKDPVSDELIPLSIEPFVLSDKKDFLKTSSSCTTIRVTLDTWCSSYVHYGYDSNCQALERGETFVSTYDVCEESSSGGSATLISGPTSTSGTGGGGTYDGSNDGGPDDPEVIGDEPIVSPPDLEAYLVSNKPTFKYPLNTDYATQFPKLTEFLRNKIPMLKDIPAITTAINDITALSLDKIKNDLEWGNGPTIVITQLNNYGDKTGPDTVGLFDGNDPEIIYLDKDWVLMMENDNYDAGLVNHFGLQANRDAFLFFLGTTVLHEYVHYGDYLNGDNYRYPATAEEGDLFETQVYGTDVNSGTLLFKSN